MLLTVVNGNGNGNENEQNSKIFISISKSERCFLLTFSDKQSSKQAVDISTLTPANLKYPGEVINKILGKYANYSEVIINEQSMAVVNHICEINRILF